MIDRILMRFFVAVLTVVVCAGCFTARRDIGPLSADEARIVAALLQQKARHEDRPRPILVLTPTSRWLPAADAADVSDLPDDVKEQYLWANGVLAKLRVANRVPATLDGIELPSGVRLCPADDYERASRSERSFRAFVASLGGVEPLVLSVSRPALDGERSLVVLRVDSTWSGEGGVNLFSVGTRASDVKLEKVLAFW